ncbi:MAG: carbohydrate binding family 9 domain-containing protein [Saprospiraceae bacterium]|nr:carbohydrate binding family 9 domain-containing protein [Saprospiraceae bacterium]
MKRLLLLATLLLLQSAVAWSQSTSNPRPQASAQQIEDPPIVDGEIQADPVWQRIAPITNLRQQRPDFDQEASERTEVRIAYDNKHLYVSAVCFDREPDKIVITDSRRDGSLENTDAFLFIIDTYYDRQNGFVFGTNPDGMEYDAQVDNEGQGNFSGNRQQRGVIGGFNLNWDASWVIRTQRGDYGWSAEFQIPLKSIRFRLGDDLTWGFNFQRNISRTNEVDLWSLLPLGIQLRRTSLAGTLTGMNMKNPGNLKLIPYVLGSVARDHTDEAGKTKARGDAGIDLKYSVTPSVTLDLTYNTDFAQVEVDDQQVNLDRFNLFFPEKRPFFLENAGLFTVGAPGEVDLFFSRRIGIADGGRQVPIIGGARLSGKLNNTNVGLLNMYTDDITDEGIQKNAFTVARVNHEFRGTRSSLGGAFINRSGLGGFENDHNSTFAIDGKYGIGPKAQVEGFFAQSATPGTNEGQHAYQLSTGYNWGGWLLRAAYTEVGKGFNPEVGFLLREDFRKADFLVFRTFRAGENSKMLENRPHISYRGYWNSEGFQETGFLHIDNHWVWRNLFEIHTGINFTKEGVTQDFEISSGVNVPAATYNHIETQIVIITNPSKPVSISTRHVNGGFFGGKRYAQSGTLSLRLGDKFISEWRVAHNDIRLPDGKFIADILGTRIAYNFTPNVFLQSLIQYNNVSKTAAVNVRFGWLQQANTGLFVVFNHGRVDGLPQSTSFIVKYSKLFDVI